MEECLRALSAESRRKNEGPDITAAAQSSHQTPRAISPPVHRGRRRRKREGQPLSGDASAPTAWSGGARNPDPPMSGRPGAGT